MGTNKDLVRKKIDELWEEEKLFLKTLGSFPSTLGNEKEVQEFIYHYLQDMGLETESVAVDPERLKDYENFGEPDWSYEDRPVVVGEWKNTGQKKGKSLILQSHMDVVSAGPEDQWDTSPYAPVIKDGKMYGRGLLDMKGGFAAIVFAVKALRNLGVELGADLQIQSVIEEECTGNGALALLDEGYTADGALIPEPTNLRLLHSQVGVMWLQVKVKGAGAHVERAESAQNAIMKAHKLMDALMGYREHINSQPKHPDFDHHPHPLNVNVGKVEGGDWASSVPTECTFDARVGFYPGTDPKTVQKEVKQWLLDAAKEDDWLREATPEITFFGFSAPGYTISNEEAIMQEMSNSHNAVTGTQAENLAFTATTDLRAYGEFNIPATCYGPIGANMHAPNEYIELDSLKTVTNVIADFILRWCEEK
ncbi:acetylornithine deacetylase [Thalassobacillus devorans]|uniref:Acetylornithine deacetylase n=1 Tax=Thalassobacillus devorans TaxID=279813 RepID=A0ABQ1NGI5_9BACI|nr:ArgE/DapE family deacylase [Thalassobacillus devorans]NIK27193.1 acetylornithine deacetylase [Thalassobacillus devorans]GGC75748.1 acetylornithine deacetylase [Thalassobacillus devorans]